MVTSIEWANNGDAPARIFITGKGTEVHVNIVAQPGQNGTHPLAVPQRFHWEDETGAGAVTVGVIH